MDDLVQGGNLQQLVVSGAVRLYPTGGDLATWVVPTSYGFLALPPSKRSPFDTETNLVQITAM